MSGRPSWKSVEIGLFRPFSAFFGLFHRVRRAPGKSRKRRKKALFLRYPQICLSPHLLNPHLRHSNLEFFRYFRGLFCGHRRRLFLRFQTRKLCKWQLGSQSGEKYQNSLPVPAPEVGERLLKNTTKRRSLSSLFFGSGTCKVPIFLRI